MIRARRSVLLPLLVALGAVPATGAQDCPSRTGGSATVLLPGWHDFAPGTRLLAYADDSCVGEATVPEAGGTALTVWEDDPFTEAVDGAARGQAVTFFPDALYVALYGEDASRADSAEAEVARYLSLLGDLEGALATREAQLVQERAQHAADLEAAEADAEEAREAQATAEAALSPTKEALATERQRVATITALLEDQRASAVAAREAQLAAEAALAPAQARSAAAEAEAARLTALSDSQQRVLAAIADALAGQNSRLARAIVGLIDPGATSAAAR